MTQSFDTIIIGAGPAGYELAALLSANNETVALIECNRLGGTCLNRGCIPTKTLCHAASIAQSVTSGPEYGIVSHINTIDMPTLMARKEQIVDGLREGIEMMLSKVNVFNATASFCADGSVSLSSGEMLSANRIVIATGSLPNRLPIEGSQYAVDSEALLTLQSLPDSLIIIGGGVIGMEFAYIYNSLGVKVTVLEYCKEILPPFDSEIAKRLRTTLSSCGIDIITSASVTAISHDGTVNYSAKGKEHQIKAEVVAMAVGRKPNLPDGLDRAGIDYSARGINVNQDTFETSRPGVYAIGDVNGLTMLAHVASAQARCLAGDQVNLSVVPSVVFTVPECAMVGLTEQQCKDSSLNYKTVKIPVRSNGKAVSMGQTAGLVKLIIDNDTRLILGCHIMAPHAGDMIQEISVIMANSLTVDSLNKTIHAHPTVAELLSTAASRL